MKVFPNNNKNNNAPYDIFDFFIIFKIIPQLSRKMVPIQILK